jgi:nitronate monooxygenase
LSRDILGQSGGKRHYEAILEATGDDTIRTTTPDIACQIQWPPGFTARVRRNAFTKRWHGRERELQQCVAVEAKYRQAFAEGDPTILEFGLERRPV